MSKAVTLISCTSCCCKCPVVVVEYLYGAAETEVTVRLGRT